MITDKRDLIDAVKKAHDDKIISASCYLMLSTRINQDGVSEHQESFFSEILYILGIIFNICSFVVIAVLVAFITTMYLFTPYIPYLEEMLAR